MIEVSETAASLPFTLATIWLRFIASSPDLWLPKCFTSILEPFVVTLPAIVDESHWLLDSEAACSTLTIKLLKSLLLLLLVLLLLHLDRLQQLGGRLARSTHDRGKAMSRTFVPAWGALEPWLHPRASLLQTRGAFEALDSGRLLP